MNELFKDILSNRFLLEDFLGYALVSFAVFAVFCICSYWKGTSKKRITFGLLVEYLWLVLCFTVICRKKGELEQFFPLPFCDYGKHEFGVLWSEMIMNIIMFLPVGTLLKLAFMRIRWYHVMAFGLSLSVSIEALQWSFKCGSCETNDLINNTIGTLIGYWFIKINTKK